MIVLDTNVVSELMKSDPSPIVLAWIDRQVDPFITAVTAAELLYGVQRMPVGQRRTHVAAAIADMIDIDFAGRVLPFDVSATVDYAELVVTRERAGRPIGMADGMIAATALSAGATQFATRNVRDFEGIGLPLIDPWTAI